MERLAVLRREGKINDVKSLRGARRWHPKRGIKYNTKIGEHKAFWLSLMGRKVKLP